MDGVEEELQGGVTVTQPPSLCFSLASVINAEKTNKYEGQYFAVFLA